MSYDELNPRQAHERLVATEDALFLDVRSVPEFEQGHPEGAWNLPLLHLTRAGMEPNADFLSVAEAVLPRDHLLVVGCKAGGRSAKACGLLSSIGFSRLINVAGGFAGAHDPVTGRLLLEGWAACGLPTSTTPMPGRSWAELSSRLS